MVRSFIPALALLALSATVGAAPALETNLDARATDDPQVNGGDFTVERWVEACAKNPDDTTTCVSPLTAAVALMNARAAKGDSSGSLSKRAPICTNAFPPADAIDALSCLSYLVRLNGTVCAIAGGEAASSSRAAIIGDAEVRISKVDPVGDAQNATCPEVARTAARFYDTCWTTDGTRAFVKGSDLVSTNPNMRVSVMKYVKDPLLEN